MKPMLMYIVAFVLIVFGASIAWSALMQILWG